jgi:hypothetical protein
MSIDGVLGVSGCGAGRRRIRDFVEVFVEVFVELGVEGEVRVG